MFCDRIERQSIDCILSNYLQEQNLSRFFFLAYYLDPRFCADKRIEENEELIAQVYDTLFSYAAALGCVNKKEEDRDKLVDSLDKFRNEDKMYGTQLLKQPKSPIKFWKYLSRFPACSKLAYCASRLLSISTKSMLLTKSLNEKCISISHNQTILTSNHLDSKTNEKLLPIRSYLLSTCKQITNCIEDKHENGKAPIDNANIKLDSSLSNDMSDIISNVITSLDQSLLIIAQPFTSSDLSSLVESSK